MSPTTAATQTLMGSAEYGARIHVSGAAAAADTTADEFTARFSVVVQLTPNATNTLSITATDAAGNTSAPTQVTIVQAAPLAVAIQNVLVDGVPCNPSAVTPPGCAVTNGQLVTFDVAAASDVPLSSIAYSAYFPSTGSNPSQRVFVPSSTNRSVSSFTFQVRSDAIETASLVASAEDSAGNLANSAAVPLNATFGAVGLGGRSLQAVASGGLLNGPTDVVQTSAGDIVIANGGSNQLLTIPSGATAPQVLASATQPLFLSRGVVAATGQETLYLSNGGNGLVESILPDGTGLATFANVNNNNAFGLALMPAIAAKGWADVNAAVSGDAVTIGTESYQFDTGGACTPNASHFCVSIASAATGAQKATALVASITANSQLVSASTPGAGSTQALLEAKTAGETGSSTVLSKSPTTSLITLSASTLIGGHFNELYVANDGDNLVRRYQLTGAPYSATTNHGAFQVSGTQRGLAVRDVFAAPSTDLEHLALYAVESGGALVESRDVVTSSSAGTVSTATSSTFTATQTTTTPLINFGQVWDVALAANGCLLVSGSGKGNIYSIDSRDPTVTSPVVSLVAKGFRTPEGLAMDNAGNLLIADFDANTVYKLSPSGASASCF